MIKSLLVLLFTLCLHSFRILDPAKLLSSHSHFQSLDSLCQALKGTQFEDLTVYFVRQSHTKLVKNSHQGLFFFMLHTARQIHVKENQGEREFMHCLESIGRQYIEEEAQNVDEDFL